MHPRANDQARFFYDLQVGFYNSVKDYVTDELGFDHILFNGSGWWGAGWLDTLDMAANLPGMDFFDQHSYGNVLRGVLRPDTDTAEKGWQYSLVERFASKAVAGYPFTVSEWNNSNNINGPMIMAAYGALNGWDGLFQYHTVSSFDGYRDNRRTHAAQLYLQYPTSSRQANRRKSNIPGRIRTCNLRLRRPTFYPIELRGPAGFFRAALLFLDFLHYNWLTTPLLRRWSPPDSSPSCPTRYSSDACQGPQEARPEAEIHRPPEDRLARELPGPEERHTAASPVWHGEPGGGRVGIPRMVGSSSSRRYPACRKQAYPTKTRRTSGKAQGEARWCSSRDCAGKSSAHHIRFLCP